MSFLTGRNVCVDGEPESCTYAQGSVLGPILFVIFINDMPDAIKNLCMIFTDDAKLDIF